MNPPPHTKNLTGPDEATAALDATTERQLQEATASLLADRTVIIVAHRPATIVSADQIVVMDGGKVVEVGAHHDLMAAGGIYAKRTESLDVASRTGFSR